MAQEHRTVKQWETCEQVHMIPDQESPRWGFRLRQRERSTSLCSGRAARCGADVPSSVWVVRVKERMHQNSPAIGAPGFVRCPHASFLMKRRLLGGKGLVSNGCGSHMGRRGALGRALASRFAKDAVSLLSSARRRQCLGTQGEAAAGMPTGAGS